MAKTPTLSDLTSLTNETAVVNVINTNNDKIITAFNNTISRDGSTPNTMLADFDINGHRIINSPDPTDPTHLVTLQYADATYGGAFVVAAQAAATASATSAAASAASAAQAALLASALAGTSTTSNTISTGVKVFTTQTSKDFSAGQFLLIPSQANAANYMHGQVVSYIGTALTVNVTNTGGSGTLSDWNIYVSGTQGPIGPSGGGGPGTGDMIGANNLIELTNLSTARTNLGLSNLATLFEIDHEIPSGVKNGVNVTFTLAAIPTAGTEKLFRNGLLQKVGAGDDYTIAGLTLTLVRAPAADEQLEVSYLKP